MQVQALLKASIPAPEKKVGGTGGGKGRPSQGKMFPRGTGK
jgi:hypothetical protein